MGCATLRCYGGTLFGGEGNHPLKVKHYDRTWESLAQYSVPDWFRDAKFVIYAHWGIYNVPGFNSEWYPKRMYVKDSPVYRHHTETYGDPSRFGYKDLIPMFKAENEILE